MNEIMYPDGWDEDDDSSVDIPIPEILSESIPEVEIISFFDVSGSHGIMLGFGTDGILLEMDAS